MEDRISSLREAQEEFWGVDASERPKIKPRSKRKKCLMSLLEKWTLVLGYSQLIFLDEYLGTFERAHLIDVRLTIPIYDLSCSQLSRMILLSNILSKVACKQYHHWSIFTDLTC